ncbi:Demethylrebeccamycin-D-glucose O-methyltransferase [Streptomyces sp. ADI92-24]|uniref:class I SAM-dependent methyltransferase n=1 Tax=Streptomyces sp. ADI92-24 TaxID=1522756 RepID=UPI000F557A0C|nr:class I SAM-dependent methyltransferase [Streptomyces sp. ADI92-24]RPK32429.1 Demethylrebeccamycin-D-glucose O-methyltransferase [Streptomyces sp. ADI92-24]
MTLTTAPCATRSSQYDAFYAARARAGLVGQLYAMAMGEDYPVEIGASSSCDWHLLGLLTARLRLRPGRVLVDAGCGTGGIGLWLARALAVRLDGFDLSSVATAQAAERRTDFLGTHSDRAVFRTAGLEDTGLPTGHAQGIVCVDALGRATDRGAALRELGRILEPGGRLVMTRALRHGAEPQWQDQLAAAGLVQEHVDERPGEPAMWERLYRLWIQHAAQLRLELGETPAERMLREAQQTLPSLHGRRAVLLTVRRLPHEPDEPRAADTMTRPNTQPGDQPTGRNPQ